MLSKSVLIAITTLYNVANIFLTINFLKSLIYTNTLKIFDYNITVAHAMSTSLNLKYKPMQSYFKYLLFHDI